MQYGNKLHRYETIASMKENNIKNKRNNDNKQNNSLQSSFRFVLSYVISTFYF